MWVNALDINGAKEKKHFFDDYRFASKGVSGKKIGKLPYGTISIVIKKSTKIVQHIYGALEIYGGTIIDPQK